MSLAGTHEGCPYKISASPAHPGGVGVFGSAAGEPYSRTNLRIFMWIETISLQNSGWIVSHCLETLVLVRQSYGESIGQ